MEYLVRLAQCHETFRQPELQAVATLLGLEMEIMAYNEFVCEFQFNICLLNEGLNWNIIRLSLHNLLAPPHLYPLARRASTPTNKSPPDTILCG